MPCLQIGSLISYVGTCFRGGGRKQGFWSFEEYTLHPKVTDS